MTGRNCWTCAHDEQRQTAGGLVFHVCRATWTPAALEWIECHVAPDAPDVPPSMPPRDAPPCPVWGPMPNRAESGRGETND